MIKIKQLFLKYKEMVLYIFFGGLTTLINIIFYFICDKIGFSTAASTVIAWIISVLFAYITNKIYVFESKTKGLYLLAKELLEFFACRLMTGVLDLIIMIFFVDMLDFNGLVIKILSNIIVIILNYVFSKIFIFKKQQ